MVLHRRSAPLKTVWNLAVVCLQTAVAVALFRAVTAGHAAAPPARLGRRLRRASCWPTPSTSVALALVVAIYEGGLVLARARAARSSPASARAAGHRLRSGRGRLADRLAQLRGAAAGRRRRLAGGLPGATPPSPTGTSTSSGSTASPRRSRSSPEVDEVLGNVLREAQELLHVGAAPRSSSSPPAERRRSPTSASAPAAGCAAPRSRTEPEDEWLLDHVVDRGQPAARPAHHPRRRPARAGWTALGGPRRRRRPAARRRRRPRRALVTDRLGDVRTLRRRRRPAAGDRRQPRQRRAAERAS